MNKLGWLFVYLLFVCLGTLGVVYGWTAPGWSLACALVNATALGITLEEIKRDGI